MQVPQHLTEQAVIDQFREAMDAAGLRTADRIIPDGEIHRFTVEGDRRNASTGWYVLFLDGLPAGEFGCWKRYGDQGITWCAKDDNQRTPEETRAMQRRIEEARAERAEREREKNEAAAQEARKIWENAAKVQGTDHPYLERKQVQSYNLRLGLWPSGMPALLVPLYDAQGQVVSLQAIFANNDPTLGRDKDFLAGGKKRGCFFTIGSPPPGGQGTIVLCEGYATAASIHESTGLFVVVAFDSGNLKPVAHEIRNRWPEARILVAADNDQWTTRPVENPGVTAARKLAEAMPSRALVAVPQFQDLDSKPTDFNDLARQQGLDAVREQIEGAIPAEEERQDREGPQTIPLDANVGPFGFPHTSDKGQPLNTPENLAYMLAEYGITVQYNVISKEVEIRIPGRTFSQDNRAAANLATIKGLCARNRMPRESLEEYLHLLADSSRINPAADWIESKPWDGKDRIQDLAATLQPSDQDLAAALLRRWMIGAAAAVYEPEGVSLQGVLVLQGAQNQGKTTWLMNLADDNRRLALEGAQLNPSDRDSVKQVISYWLVELGELDATFRKADIAALKSFITKKQDELFLRYSRAISQFPRRTAFAASVNEKAYLRDETGNRRYWTIQCGEGMRAVHDVDMQQAWAQARQLYLDGEQYRLTRDEMERLNAVNVDHQEISPVEELVLTRFDWENQARPEIMTATDVLLFLGYDRPNTKQVRECGGVLRKLTGGEPRKSNGKQVFDLPPRVGRAQPSPYAGDEDRPL